MYWSRVLESVSGSRQRVTTWALPPRMLEVNFFWAPNVGETMSSDTRDGILFENTETRLVIERGPAIRNANCEDTETVLLIKVADLMLLCLP